MIQLFHVNMMYPGAREPTLKDITLTIEKGSFVFLTGPSGAGKSTLLKLLFAAETPSRGQILVAGHNLATLSKHSIPYLRRNIGVVFQDFKLLPNLTVFDNIAVVLQVLGKSSGEIYDKVYGILKHVGLAHKRKEYPLRLSGGEQQRVAVARALVNDPQILIADEPTGNLDPQLTDDIMDLIKTANARGTTIFVATHDHGLLDRYGDRVVRLENGVLIGN